MRFRSAVAILLVTICCGGCNAATPHPQPHDEAKDFAAEFSRTGGLAGSFCNFVIHADGTYLLHRSRGGQTEGEAGTISSRKEWADLLTSLKSGKNDYSMPSVMDGYEFTASWNDNFIKWNPLNPRIPPALQTLTDRLNRMFDESSTKGAS